LETVPDKGKERNVITQGMMNLEKRPELWTEEGKNDKAKSEADKKRLWAGRTKPGQEAPQGISTLGGTC